jgi:hypothetical protein
VRFPSSGGCLVYSPHNSNWTGLTGNFPIQISGLVDCPSQPLANNTCFAHSSSKPRFSCRDFHGILRADTTRSVCQISHTVRYCPKDHGGSGFTSWQGKNSVFSPWSPGWLWTSPSVLPDRIKWLFLEVKQTGLETVHTYSSMETSYFKSDCVHLWDFLKHLEILIYPLQKTCSHVNYCTKHTMSVFIANFGRMQNSCSYSKGKAKA